MTKQPTIFDEMGFDPEMAQPVEAIAYSVIRTAAALVKTLNGIYAKHDLTAPSLNLLIFLKHGRHSGAVTQQEVSRLMIVTASNMTGMIDRLELRGLVRRVAGTDRRQKLLSITDKGKKLIDDVWPEHLKALESICKGLGARQGRELVDLLAVLRRSLPMGGAEPASLPAA